LPQGVALHITAAKWLTPNGKWINEVGLEPSVKIEDNPETIEDEQLNKAVDLIETESALVKK
jgi:carboxyl-terminal processing protease